MGKRTASTCVGALAVLLSACGSGGGEERHLITGSFTLLEDADGPWTRCTGEGDYSDFGPGMNVTVRDGENNIIGTGTTRSLARTDLPADDVDEGDRTPLMSTAILAETVEGFGCIVWFEVEVGDAESYVITVGKRGDQTYSASELEARDWPVEMTLGD